MMEQVLLKPKFQSFDDNLGVCPYSRWARFIQRKSGNDIVPCQVDDTDVFVGSLASAMNTVELERLRISAVLTVGDHLLRDNPGLTVGNNDFRIRRAVLRLRDSHDEALFDGSLQNALEFISETVSSGERVLVHCEQGISRSVAVVCAYLIDFKSFGFEDALELIRQSRPQAKPNLNFSTQLRQRARRNHDSKTGTPIKAVSKLREDSGIV